MVVFFPCSIGYESRWTKINVPPLRLLMSPTPHARVTCRMSMYILPEVGKWPGDPVWSMEVFCRWDEDAWSHGQPKMNHWRFEFLEPQRTPRNADRRTSILFGSCPIFRGYERSQVQVVLWRDQTISNMNFWSTGRGGGIFSSANLCTMVRALCSGKTGIFCVLLHQELVNLASDFIKLIHGEQKMNTKQICPTNEGLQPPISTSKQKHLDLDIFDLTQKVFNIEIPTEVK